MQIRFQTGNNAFQAAKNNSNRATQKWAEDFCGIANISHKPKFNIRETSKFFTIGSCFARNLENVLRMRRITLLSEVPVLPAEYFEYTGGTARTGYQNIYTPGSVLEAIKLANTQDPYQSIIGEGDNYFDLLTSGLRPLPFEKITEVRNGLVSGFKKIQEADILVITLGYNEAWYHIPSKSFINQTPSHISLRKKIQDFSFSVLSYNNVYDLLNQSISRLKEIAPQCKIILTVSPVPLGSTFTESHVVVANQLSKSVLRTVAQQISDENEHIDYFPSYELVVNSSKENAFEKDGVHVRQAIVEKVMDLFFSSYFLPI
ncbi:GSCFA family protein [Azotobacter beijerinckii]|uniref:GSCFA family protein n=1 Tax=Azotobacter beijerinckii TaxID=170623 RepID=A0A1H9NGL9_9GAMM|nr:GSCFA domain-containing protein [Azotobacter beijerinckii]SER35134.1 GSCFA family protein [Azotobacter beijerinckii]